MNIMEWIEYVALFYNREREAVRIVNDMKARYDCIVSFVRRQPEVRVLYATLSTTSNQIRCGFTIATWHKRMIEDIGGKVLDAYPGFNSNGPCNMTAFREVANTADVWLFPANNFQEGRYGSSWSVMWNISAEIQDVAPFRNNRTFDSNGNHFRDYFASRMVELDVELEDLVQVFHPVLNYSHDRVWWMNVRTETDPGRPTVDQCACKYGPQPLKADACPGNPATAPGRSQKPQSDYGCNGELAASVCDAQSNAITCGRTTTVTATATMTATQAATATMTTTIAQPTPVSLVSRVVQGTLGTVVTTTDIMSFVQDTKVQSAFAAALAEACGISASYVQVDLAASQLKGRRLAQIANIVAMYTIMLPASAPAELTTLAVTRKLQQEPTASLASRITTALASGGFPASATSVEVVMVAVSIAQAEVFPKLAGESADTSDDSDFKALGLGLGLGIPLLLACSVLLLFASRCQWKPRRGQPGAMDDLSKPGLMNGSVVVVGAPADTP